MTYSNKKQTYRYNKAKRCLVPDAVIDLQAELNSYREDTLDAILKRLLDSGSDPSELINPAVTIDMDSVVDDFSGDLFDLVSDYGDALEAIGVTEKDPQKVIQMILDNVKPAAQPAAQPVAQAAAQPVAQPAAQPAAHEEDPQE